MGKEMGGRGQSARKMKRLPGGGRLGRIGGNSFEVGCLECRRNKSRRMIKKTGTSGKKGGKHG